MKDVPHVPGAAAAPGGLATNLLLAILTTAGLFYVDIMPALVAALRDGAGFTAKQAGLVVAANVYGAAAGGLLAVFTIKKLPWRRAAAVSLLLLIGLDLACMGITSPATLIEVRFLHGVVGGLLVGTGYSLIARTAVPNSAFATLFFLQFSLGGLGVAILPNLVPRFGPSVLFVALALFSAITLIVLPLVPVFPWMRGERGEHPQAQRRPLRVMALCAALAAVFLFQAANMSFTAFAIGVGRQLGHTTEFVSHVLGAAQWIAIIGPLAVIAFGTRFGRVMPLFIAITLGAAAKTAFVYGALPIVFMLAAAATALTIAFTLPYLLGLCAAFDPSGRTATLGGFFSKLGLASGPAAGAVILQSNGYLHLIAASALTTLLAAIAATFAARRLERS